MYDFLSMDEVTWSYIVFAFASFPWILYGFVTMFFVLSISYGRLKLHRKTDPLTIMEKLPGVSVIKPLMGVDAFLESNLESHFSLTYPKFELLICVQDDQDPVITLVNKLKERYPKVECRMFMGGKNGILNPLVNNMAPAYEAARYDVIWISTSRIKVSTDILLDMVGKLENPKVALVHQMPYCTDQQGLAASIEKVYFGATVARYYMSLSVLGVSCFTGMSYLLKKVELDELHGLTWFGRFLAEDFFIAKYLHQKGFRHRVAAVPAQQNYTATSVAVYKDRMVRWMRLRLNMMPIMTGFFEPLCESIPLGVYMSWSMYHFFGFNPYIWFACHWSVWCLLDYIQLTGVQHGPLPFSKFMFLVSWMIREMLFILVYFEAIFNVRHIKWGRRTYRLSNFGESIAIANDKSILPI